MQMRWKGAAARFIFDRCQKGTTVIGHRSRRTCGAQATSLAVSLTGRFHPYRTLSSVRFRFAPPLEAFEHGGVVNLEYSGDRPSAEPLLSQDTHSCVKFSSPYGVALAPKCSTASAFRNGANSRRGVRWANLKNWLFRASFRALALRSSVQPELASDAADVSPRVQGRPNRFL